MCKISVKTTLNRALMKKIKLHRKFWDLISMEKYLGNSCFISAIIFFRFGLSRVLISTDKLNLFQLNNANIQK